MLPVFDTTFVFFQQAWNRQVKQAQEGARNLKVVFAQPLQGGSFVIKKYPKSDTDNRVVDAALKSNFVFGHLSPSKRDDLISAFEPVMVKKGTNIITEGEQGDFFYIIGTGEVTFGTSCIRAKSKIKHRPDPCSRRNWWQDDGHRLVWR